MIRLCCSGVCSLASHIVVKEASLALTLERVDLATHTNIINAKGSVLFLLLDSGKDLSEGPIICQYDLERSQVGIEQRPGVAFNRMFQERQA